MHKLVVIVHITYKVHKAYMTVDSNRRRNAFAFNKMFYAPSAGDHSVIVVLLCVYCS